MSIKSVLREAIMRLGSRASIASEKDVIAIENTVGATQASGGGYSRKFVAPYDGLVVAFLQADKISSASVDPGVSIQIANNNSYRVAMRTQDGGISLLVAKGDSVEARTYDEGVNVLQRKINFYKTWGGG